jgi:hypothetical protein
VQHQEVAHLLVFPPDVLGAIGRRRIAFSGEIVPSSPEMAARYRGYLGFDGIPMGAFTQPALSTVAQDTKRAGDLLVQTLIHLIGEPAECVTLPPRLIVRGSSGAPVAVTCR